MINSDFEKQMHRLLSADEYTEFMSALSQPPSLSVRMNPRKPYRPYWFRNDCSQAVPWCKDGLYLSERPVFALDPGWSAGAYYVQDASSMFYCHLIKQVCDTDKPLKYLDVCAAPGGKTTCALSVLHPDSLVVANEYVQTRANVLHENLRKWGAADVIVTSAGPQQLQNLNAEFDVVAVDAPCSGEGMMRKEAVAVSQWRPELVRQCADLQWEIVSSVWHLVKPGGLMIYSTCTYNHIENEEIISKICMDLGAETIDVPVDDSWCIKQGIDTMEHCYRFMPHLVQGEGLFVTVLRKCSDDKSSKLKSSTKGMKQLKQMKNPPMHLVARYLGRESERVCIEENNIIYALLSEQAEMICKLKDAKIKIVSPASALAVLKGKEYVSETEAALSYHYHDNNFAPQTVELSLPEARAYLRREALSLSDNPMRGFLCAIYENLPLGMLKNLGNRANNLWPKPWQIRIRE